MIKTKNFVMVMLILLLGLVFRLYHLDKHSLWYDEAITVLDEWGVDQLPSLARLFDNNFLLQNNDFLTLYSHGFVYYWQSLFGKSEFALRLSSVIFSILSIYLLYRLARDVFGEKTAYLASFLLAISPFSIHYAQELRPYAATSLLTLLAAYSLLKLIETNKIRFVFVYILCNVVNIYFHYMNILVLFSFIIFLLYNYKNYRPLLKIFIIQHTIILVLIIPLLFSAFVNLKSFLNISLNPAFTEFPIWGGIPEFKQLLFTFKNLAVGYNIDYYFGKYIVFAYFLLLLIIFLRYRRKTEIKLFLSCLFIPILLLYLISKIKTCYVDRYLFPVSSFYLGLIAFGLSKMRNKIFWFCLCLIVICNFIGIWNYFLDYLPGEYMQHVGISNKQNIKLISESLIRNYQKGDKIIHTCKNTVFPLKFYIRQLCNGRNRELADEVNSGMVISFPNLLKDKNIVVYKYNLLHPLNVSSPEKYDIFNDDKFKGRIWLVFSSWNFMSPSQEERMIVDFFESNFKEEAYVKACGATLYLFSKNI